ncbi:hypothetical protein Tco_1224652, partial [Tanacetum coccineum]
CELQSSKTFLKSKEVPQGKNPGAKSGLRRKQSSKHTFESKTEASKSKTSQSEIETQSILTKDKSLSHPSPPTPVVGEMHRGTTSNCFFHLHSESASVHDASVDSTTEANLGNSALNDSIPAQQDQTKSAGDGLKTAHTDSEEEVEKDDTHAISHDVPEDTSIPHPPSLKSAQIQELMAQARPLYPDINQLTDLLVTSLNPEFSKLLASHDFSSCLPNALKELPSKFTELSRDIIKLKNHVQDMEIELPRDLKEIPTKLETFTSTISSLSSQEKLKTLDFLPSLLNKVTDFSTMVENASGAVCNNVPSAGQASASPVKREKNTTKDAETNLQNELVDLLGIDMVEQYHNKKLLFDKYCDKMLKRRKSSKIINCDVLAQKGPISLKIYREDGTIEVIANIKISDLHLAEWREVVQACPDRKEKEWKTVYGLINTRIEYLDQTEKELKIDFNKPIKE